MIDPTITPTNTKEPLTSTTSKPSKSQKSKMFAFEPEMSTIFEDPNNKIAEDFYDYEKEQIRDLETTIMEFGPKSKPRRRGYK